VYLGHGFQTQGTEREYLGCESHGTEREYLGYGTHGREHEDHAQLGHEGHLQLGSIEAYTRSMLPEQAKARPESTVSRRTKRTLECDFKLSRVTDFGSCL
jgi:hypothetical protein